MKGNLSARFGFPIWTGCGFYFLCTCLSHPFSLGANRVSSISRKDISILRFPVWEQQVPPGCPLKWGLKASWCFIALMRTRGKDRLVFVEWSCRKINMADLLLQAGQASHLLPACPYSLPQSRKWTCFPGHLVVAARLIEVSAGLFKQVSCKLSETACKRWSQPFTCPSVFASLQCEVAVLSIKK